MSRGTMRADVRMRLAEVQPDFWTGDNINDLLNWAHRQAVKKIRPYLYFREQSINCTDTVSEYTNIPTDMLAIIGVMYGDPTASEKPKALHPLSKRGADVQYQEQSISGQEPEFYTLIGRGPSYNTAKLIITPPADETITNGIKFLYLERPPDFDGDNDGAKADEVEDVIVPLVAYRCWLMQGGQFTVRADIALSEANWLIKEAKASIGVQPDRMTGVPCTKGIARRR